MRRARSGEDDAPFHADVVCTACGAELGEVRAHPGPGSTYSSTLTLAPGLVSLPDPHPDGWLRFGLPRNGRRLRDTVHTRVPGVWVYCPQCGRGQLVYHRGTMMLDRPEGGFGD